MDAFVMMASRAPIDQSLELLLKGYKLDPGDYWAQDTLSEYHMQKARNALQERNFEAALMDYIQAWKYRPKGSEVPVIAGYYFLDQEDLDSAEEWAMQALAKNPLDSLAWTLRGRILLVKGKPELAVPLFERALDNFKQYQDAMKVSQVLTAFGQDNPSVLRSRTFFFMGEAFRQMGNKPEALKYYEQALFLNPGYVEALLASGQMFLDLGQLEISLQRFSKAVELAPDNAFAHLLYAHALERAPERRQDAIREIQTFLGMVPKDWPGRAKVEERLKKLLTGR
jgi:tetratricopeptide (TPR) repeat protein